jgi:putative endonuclease
MRNFYVYILFNPSRTLYTGITNHLPRRLREHRDKRTPGFTARYNVTQLAYYEVFETAADAIRREKQIKGWARHKKITLIESMNPHWEDLSSSLAE